MKHYYQLKVGLNDLYPNIWRQIIVPASISLDRLSDVIQIVIGWENIASHYWATASGEFFAEYIPPRKNTGVSLENQMPLFDILNKKGQEMEYMCVIESDDLSRSDRWRHIILLEDDHYKLSLYEKEDDRLPFVRCVAGFGKCPPENVGGIGGFYAYRQIMTERKQPQFGNMFREHGGINCPNCHIYDPNYFDIDTVNRELKKYCRWSRNRHYLWLEEEDLDSSW
ncbi:plasmid pRiA4b ORF-3 family protein [Neisseria sp. Ec49-e6-T10]|uniref:plasmid pRiA4b ORF-3 family protein n=1 Tax=Neisseria sp. Ec49-e6-T10 TaxID=3140744 RepID=UPI003EBAC47E